MEQNLSKTAVEEDPCREVDTETKAVQLAAKMVADLTVEARKIANRKAKLEQKIVDLTEKLDAAQ